MTTASRRGAAVLGSPVSHSLSPVLHQAAYDALGLADWTYQAVECTEAELGLRLCELEAMGLVGASLTMPLKRAVMTALHDADRWAPVVGAANTVLFSTPDEWYGANTDVPGMVTALNAAELAPYEATPWVLGAGATAASALAALGALGYQAATVVARRPEAAAELREVASRIGLALDVRPWSALADAADAPLVISTTPASASAALTEALGPHPGVLFDVIYSPWPTPLASAWQASGGFVIGGLELLIEQAALQVALMTGQAAPLDAMRQAGYAALRANP